MKNWKRFLGIGLGICMIFGNNAYGEALAAGKPFVYETMAETSVPGPGLGGGTHTAGPGAGDGVRFGGPGEASQEPGTQMPGTGRQETQMQPPGGGSQPSAGETPAGAAVPQPGAPDQAAGNEGRQPGAENQPSGIQAADPNPAGSGMLPVTEPEIAAEGAVLMDGATGKVLYGKNPDQQFYPASITKVMTALLTLERCKMGDMVNFSASATTNLESGAVSLNITEGDRLTIEQCLYGLMLKSANEIGNGLAEHIAGTVQGFAELMNQKAGELGCQNTHFANPHGLNDASHKTTPRDMALIMRAALQNDMFRRITTTCSYDFPATKKEAARTITMGHKMLYPTDSRYYEGIIGGKTGYTSLAGNTLVTGAEKNGVRLIVVVMKAKQTHYADTKALLDYGFANYEELMRR